MKDIQNSSPRPLQAQMQTMPQPLPRENEMPCGEEDSDRLQTPGSVTQLEMGVE